jgi:hypothetical protein
MSGAGAPAPGRPDDERLPDGVQVWWTTRQTFINDAPDPVAFGRAGPFAPSKMTTSIGAPAATVWVS